MDSEYLAQMVSDVRGDLPHYLGSHTNAYKAIEEGAHDDGVVYAQSVRRCQSPVGAKKTLRS